LLRDHSQRATAGNAARNILPFGQAERPPRTAADRRDDSTMTLQQKANDHMVFAHRTANSMQGFSRLPTTPDLSFCVAESGVRFLGIINTTCDESF
jgi:hypothetical protein